MRRRQQTGPKTEEYIPAAVNDLFRVVVSSEDHLPATVIVRIDRVAEHSVEGTITRIEESEAPTGDRRKAFELKDEIFVWRSAIKEDMRVSASES